MNWGLYIHIAYCEKRCLYCDFYTNTTTTGVPEQYIDSLISQLNQYYPLDDAGEKIKPSTVYFGGGTPSLLEAQQVERLLAAANPASDAEITMEANPESTTLAKLKGWRSAGVNRISFGVQTADDESLKTLGRLHTAGDAKNALRNAAAAGFSNISGDIILALPNYSAKEFDKTLELLHDEGVTHISAYLLKIEPGSAFGKSQPWYLPDEDEAAAHYMYAVSRLEQCGYRQYEVSNFAISGYESAHNLLYWNCGEWLGIGCAAHSCLGGQRFSFNSDLREFLAGRSMPIHEGELTVQDYIMLKLRLNKGLNLQALSERFGKKLSTVQMDFLGKLKSAGLVIISPEAISLTPQGMLVQNSILAQLEMLE